MIKHRVQCPFTFFTVLGLCDIFTHTQMKLESLVLFCSPVFHQSHGIEVNVTDKDGKLCLYANLMVNFTVLYEATGNKVSVSTVITRAGPRTLWKWATESSIVF